MKSMKIFVIMLGVFLFRVGFVCSQELVSSGIKEADSLYETYAVDGIKRSVEIYREIIKNNPDDYEALWKASRSLNTIMDIKTNQAIITTEGLSDTKENRKIWAELGKEALNYSKRARKVNPEGTDAMIWHAVSYAYYSSSFGILKAIFSGAAGKFKKNAKRLINHVPDTIGGLGNRHLGILYLAAPFPVGSVKKAEKEMRKALEINDKFLLNHYYYGLALYRLKKYDEARSEFEFVHDNEPLREEAYCIKAFKDEAGVFLQLIEQK